MSHAIDAPTACLGLLGIVATAVDITLTGQPATVVMAFSQYRLSLASKNVERCPATWRRIQCREKR
jgi:hypothetical protein